MGTWFQLSLGMQLANIGILIVAVAIILLLISIFLKKTGIAKIRYKDIEVNTRQNKNKKENTESLLNHRFFKYIELNHRFSIYQKDIMEDKDIINSLFLQNVLFKVLYDDLYNFIEDIEKNNGISLDNFIEVLNQCLKNYELLSKTIVIQLNGDSVIMGIPTSYYNKLNNWLTPHIKLCLEGIQGVLENPFYDHWKYKAYVCLEYLYMLTQLIIEDAQNTLPELNGDLSKEIEEKKKKITI